MTDELSKTYEPSQIEEQVHDLWTLAEAFAAIPDERENRYVIMMPLPNVTGSLHMGHAMDNVMQDLLIRWHRQKGDNTLWMPGTDHAGIATQAVVEKCLFELEGKTRHDIGREKLVERIWEWKDQYQKRIVNQQQAMGCSCDWGRQRFTMDRTYTRAVRELFFRLFRDGLIFRGNRLVNWDCHLQTAVSDDEIVHETVNGHFWHLRYPVVDPNPGEPEHVIVATTRPETMLGDTAVAVHPDPRGVLEGKIADVAMRVDRASEAERDQLQAELDALQGRKRSHLPVLEKLVTMAKAGRKLLLPLQDREIPIILDEWAKPELGSGCVKITPAHDPNDYDVWTRHRDEIGIVNILEPDGTLNANAGGYAGKDRFEARKLVVADLDALGLLEDVEDRDVEIGHSDRSKTPVEPYLSKQWFVRMGDVDGGVVLGRGTPGEFTATGLAQAAIDAVHGDWRSITDRKLTFHPDAARYGSTYVNWLAEKRDWCISRQLWWGHRIPIWYGSLSGTELVAFLDANPDIDSEQSFARVEIGEDRVVGVVEAKAKAAAAPEDRFEIQVCLRSGTAESGLARKLEQSGLLQDPDVLDTWFSSALFPHATLGWPDPETAEQEDGQRPLGAQGGRPDALSYYYPGSCLVTARDIITLWVARMVIVGLYNLGDVPFTDCFVHANIQDGKGERMSKSKGNGIDPVDIIGQYGADAMRYVLCEMQTGLQDIRLPVQAISPFTGKPIELATAKRGRSIFTYLDPETGEEFDVLGTIPELPSAKIVSDRFEIGRNFCNKLWNSARFALMNFGEQKPGDWAPLSDDDLEPEDRWILSCLGRAIQAVSQGFEDYNPSAAIGRAREFFWAQLCDWYLELIKPRTKREDRVVRQVLAFAVDQVLRLLHPMLPFVTEAIWQRLNAQVPERGIARAIPVSDLLIRAAWPQVDAVAIDEPLEREFATLQGIVRGVRELRQRYTVAPSKRLDARIKAAGAIGDSLNRYRSHLENLGGLETCEIGPDVERPKLSAVQVVGDVEIYLSGVVDPEKERERLEKQRDKLTKGISASQGKLKNRSFVERAPESVVNAERERLTDLERELAGVEQNLAELD